VKIGAVRLDTLLPVFARV